MLESSDEQDDDAVPNLDRNLVLLFFVNLIVAAYWNMTGPLVPLFIKSLEATVFQVSLVLFIGGLASTLIMMPSGVLSDKYGERRMIILSVVLLTVSPLLYTTAGAWEETIPYTVINMICFGLFTPARMTMIAKSVKQSSMATAYGLMNLAWPIGGVIGPFIGGFLADNYGWNAFFYSLSSTAAMCTLISLFLSEIKEEPATLMDAPRKGSFGEEATLLLLIFVLLHIFSSVARGILGTVFPFHLDENFHKSKTEIGLFFSVGFGIATLVAQIPSGLLADKHGRKKIMAVGTLPIPLLAFLFPSLDDYLLLLVVYMLITGLWSTTWPASAAYLMSMTPASKRGIMMGIRQTAVRLGFTVGPLIGGALWDAFSPDMSFYTTTVFFVASSVLVLLLKE